MWDATGEVDDVQGGEMMYVSGERGVRGENEGERWGVRVCKREKEEERDHVNPVILHDVPEAYEVTDLRCIHEGPGSGSRVSVLG